MRAMNLALVLWITIGLFLAPALSKEEAPEPDHWTHRNQTQGWSTHTGVQSPIALHSPPIKPASLRVSYGEQWAHRVRNTGHGWQLDFHDAQRGGNGGTLQLGDRTFNLMQFHFHTQSEHTVKDVQVEGYGPGYYPMELHFVHKDAAMLEDDVTKSAKSLAVVGVFITIGKHNPALQRVWDGGQQPFKFDALTLLPKTGGYWAYKGSLTTPPNTEGVSWIVFKDPIEASPEQIRAFVTAMKKERGSGIAPNLVNRKIQAQVAGHELMNSDTAPPAFR